MHNKPKQPHIKWTVQQERIANPIHNAWKIKSAYTTHKLEELGNTATQRKNVL